MAVSQSWRYKHFVFLIHAQAFKKFQNTCMYVTKGSGAKTDNSIFFVFEKNEIKVLNLLGNALENFHIFTHKIKVVC
jgi:hypothetical protein